MSFLRQLALMPQLLLIFVAVCIAMAIPLSLLPWTAGENNQVTIALTTPTISVGIASLMGGLALFYLLTCVIVRPSITRIRTVLTARDQGKDACFSEEEKNGSSELSIIMNLLSDAKKHDSDDHNYLGMLDNLPINVMACDVETLTINYANQSSKDTFQQIHKLLPVSPHAVIGTCIDRFHKDPAHIRRILANEKNFPHEAIITLGSELLSLRVDMMRDQNGKPSTLITTWSVETGVERLKAELRELMHSMSSISEELSQTAKVITQNSSNAQERSSNVASASEQAACNVQTIAAATEEFTASIKKIYSQVDRASDITKDAANLAGETSTRVANLSEASQKIEDVLQIISTIASQINLLALNATIESARAGEAGKGFAVVANEVKNLATQTAKATEEITGQITAMQESVDATVADINSVTETISQLDQISASIATAMQEQSATTSEITRSIQETATGTSEVSRNIHDVSSSIEETTRSTHEIATVVQDLGNQATKMRTLLEEVDNA